jgi:hypothetical protein
LELFTNLSRSATHIIAFITSSGSISVGVDVGGGIRDDSVAFVIVTSSSSSQYDMRQPLVSHVVHDARVTEAQKARGKRQPPLPLFCPPCLPCLPCHG